MTPVTDSSPVGLLQRMHPLHRLITSLIFSVVVYFIIPRHSLSPLLLSMLLWVVFALVFNATGWIVLFTRPIHHIQKIAREEDGSKVFVFGMVVVSSFASLFTVLLLMLSDDSKTSGKLLYLLLTVGGMLLSWIMVHTLFTFHYAHMYYDDTEDSDTEKGLDFPGKEDLDYLDFAYFSFVIGCTFQVSDVQISSRKIRRVVLLHGLLSFALNTFVVALTINLIAGLNK